VHIYDAAENVFQVPESVIPRPKSGGATVTSSRTEFTFVEEPFSFAVTRTSSGEVLFNTTGQQLIFESQYVRLRTSLPQNANLYGLGEHSDDFRFNTNGYQRVLWNSESPFIPRNANLYGSHPNYVDYRGAKGTHGVFLLNSDGMNININTTAEETFLEYNTIGGVLDFYFFAGPDPADVSRQYAEVVGAPAMVPYWSFGFHQCKYGWPNVDYVNEVVTNYSKAGIPLEVMWGDIDYMDHRQDFTLDPTNYPLEKMRDLVGRLHGAGQRYVMMLDPGIHRKGGYEPYESGVTSDVFLKAADGSLYRGQQWAGEVLNLSWSNLPKRELIS
jgi:alpha-glucosidase